MRKQIVLSGLAVALAACGSDGPREAPEAQGSPPEAAAVRQETSDSPVLDSAVLSDPEAANGLTRTMLGAKAFTVNDFGSAPEGNAEDVIKSLESAARGGSGRASYQIFLKLFQCINVLKPSRRADSVDGQAWEDCKDLSPDRMLQGVDWLRLAASQGHLGAQVYFTSDAEFVLGGVSGMFKDPEAITEYKRQSMDYIEANVRRGHVDALSHLANDYYMGLRVEQDLVTSHAYFLAYERAYPSAGSNAMQKYVRDLLTPEQVTKSNEVARKIYEECCSAK